jgi:hypothetical protein
MLWYRNGRTSANAELPAPYRQPTRKRGSCEVAKNRVEGHKIPFFLRYQASELSNAPLDAFLLLYHEMVSL